MKKKLFYSILSVLLVSQSFYAQTHTDSLQVDLQAVNVTAQRAKIFSSQARMLTVIDRKAIQQLPVTTIDELLESVTGIDIRNRGVGGTQADISIRGGSFDQVLVLLNGINITDPQTGHYNLDLPVELPDVVRVELLQGSAARIYGPNAFSGAINIVTEKKETASVAVQNSGGSYNTFVENVSAGLGNQKIQTFISATHKQSDGYIANTDYDILNVFSQTVWNAGGAGKFDLQLGYQNKSYGANGFYSLSYPNQFDHTKTAYGSLNWQLQLNAKTQLSAQMYARRHYDRFELYRDMEGAASWYTGHNYHLTDVRGVKAAASFVDRFGKVTAGMDVRNEHIYSTVLGVAMDVPVTNVFDKDVLFKYESERLLPTLFVDYALTVGDFYVSAGLSSTYSDQFGTFSSGGLDASYRIAPELSLFLSANSALRLPTFTDLYYKSATQMANPALKPEKSKTIELGAKYDHGNLKFNSSVFYRFGENVIDWVKEPDSIKWQSKNLTEVNAVGVDLLAEYSFRAGFVKKVSIAYSYLTLDKTAGTYDSKYALDFLKHKLQIYAQHHIVSALSATWKLAYYDRAGDYTDPATAMKVSFDPYFMADVRLQWSKAGYSIFADLNNLLNTTYADFGGLKQPGRNFAAGVRLKID